MKVKMYDLLLRIVATEVEAGRVQVRGNILFPNDLPQEGAEIAVAMLLQMVASKGSRGYEATVELVCAMATDFRGELGVVEMEGPNHD